MKKGIRCQVCTGCGLCPGVNWGAKQNRDFDVLADSRVWEGLSGDGRKDHYVVAADIGTTTIAMVLRDGTGAEIDRYLAVNPQREFGADVISRIQQAAEPLHAEQMRSQVLGVLQSGLERFRRKTGRDPLRMTIAANTTETYLLMGWDTSELGRAPFTVSHREAVCTRVSDVETYVLPRLSAFVGGDIVAGILACDMQNSTELTLLVDLGTNGELVLGNSEGMMACATAAGPAFEGGANVAVWGADMISALAALLREKAVDETGLLAEPYFQTGVRVGNVPVRQEAVRALQLAKAAIAAGIDTLMERRKIKAADIQRVILAGGFGYYLKPADAVAIGLLPQGLAEKTISGGNTALLGAGICACELLEQGQTQLNQRWSHLAGKCQCMNLAQEPSFEERYLRHLALCPYE